MKISISFIILSLVLGCLNLSSQTKPISLADIWQRGVFMPVFQQEWQSHPDPDLYTMLSNNKIIAYQFETGKEKSVLVDGSKLTYNGKVVPIEEYIISQDGNTFIIGSNLESIYRHSVKGNYYVYFKKENKFIKIDGEGNVRLPDISPDGHKIAYVRENNLYVLDLSTLKEITITSDGKFNEIINGSTDWVYEEEFGFTKGFEWSPDGQYIAFYRMDESKVKQFTLTYYGDLYPEEYKYKYPKAGEDNSLVDIYIYNCSNNTKVKTDLGSVTDQYVPRIKWTYLPGTLAIQRLNRLQNHLDILFANATDGKTKVISSDENKCFVEITDDWHFLKDGRWFITSEKSGFNHIYLYDANGALISQVTNGNWDVKSVAAFDEKKSLVYYNSYEDGAMNQMLYSVNISTGEKKKITEEPGTHEITFSSGYQYFNDNFSNANLPPVYRVCNASGKILYVTENNQKLVDITKEYGFTPKEFFTCKATDGTELNGWMIKPANLEKGKKYPVLMYVYGGPGAQTVENSWGYYDLAWFEMLAQKGYIVVSVDNRGTSGKGESFKKATYLQLGKYETEDQIDVAKYLGTLDYVDAGRIGMFGWSFGGYLTSLCMTKGADYFKTGIAVAPVTNWRYYDNIYTERYMRTPQENADGYDKNSPMFFAKKLKGKFLLVHGSADDNVHMQNSMDFITELVKANKDFEMFLYPNKNHGIYGGNTRYHLYNKMTNFILNNL